MRRFKVVVSDSYYDNLNIEVHELCKIGAQVFDYHCKTEEEVIDVTGDADALIVQYAPITRRVIENLKRCKVIVRYGIGVDNIDVAEATSRGIYVANVPDYSIDEVSNHAIALLLACARKLTVLADDVQEGNWRYKIAEPLYRVQGRTLGLMGFGRIPQQVAKKMKAFGVEIIAYDPFVSYDEALKIGVKLVDLETLLTNSDYLSVHCPLNDATRYLINRSAFKKMKSNMIFINTSRGEIVCEKDLIWALENGEIAQAGIDVCQQEPIPHSSPLLKMSNVIITPHIAWYSVEAVQSLQQMVAEEVARVLTGEKPKNPLNQPFDK
jgi:D-3-phosphoglycerate dehydrogenase / 2-oxoglutarate reductase